MFSKLLEFVCDRRDPQNHSIIDCSLIFSEEWLESPRPIFFYGLAHILKHHGRRKAYEIIEKETFDAKELQALERTIGWADEFFWLGIWSHRSKLRGRPKFEEIRDPSELFFQALVHMEWGDLLREAWFFHRKGLVKPDHADNGITGQSERASAEPDRADKRIADQFEIWKPRFTNKRLDDDLYDRALARYRNAGDAIRTYEEPPIGEIDASKAIKRNLWLGLGRLHHAFGQRHHSIPFLQDAEALIAQDNKEREISLLLSSILSDESIEDLDQVCFDFFRAKELCLTPTHVLGEWIEDLLLDERYGILHPRLVLPKDLHDTTGITTFPNLAMIQRLEDLLKEHRDWLRFVTENSAGDEIGFKEAMATIEIQDSSLRGAMFAPKKQDDGDLSSWELWVLRDWGSYTPILPFDLRNPSGHYDKYAKQGGGGYFLRYGRYGIVIDPGFDFIEHFFEAGLGPDAITHIVVTHDHYDHAASFGPLLNLLFQFNESRRKSGESTQKVDFLLCRGTLDQYARFIVDYRYYGKIVPLTDRDGKMGREHILSETEPAFALHTTHTEHALDDGFGKGVGLVFKFGNRLATLGITSDTGWYSEYMLGKERETTSLGKTFEEHFEEHSPGVLVLHVGSLKQDELRNSGFYKTHLGARGVFLSIAEIKKCRLAILSEFGEECRGYRRWFAKRIDRYFREKSNRSDFRCFPSDRKTRILAKDDDLFMWSEDSKKFLQYRHAIVDDSKESELCFIESTQSEARNKEEESVQPSR